MHPTVRSVLLPLLFTSSALHAQQWQWADQGAGEGSADGQAMATDAQGNSVVVGNYHSTFTIGGQLFSTPDDDGIFMAKFDPNGVMLWARLVANAPGIAVHGVTCDDAGAIGIVGMYQGTVAFHPIQLGPPLTALGSFDVFVVKYDGEGTPLWSRSIGEAGYDYGASICHDGFSNFYVTGDLHMSAFNQSASKVFVTKFAFNGTQLWNKSSAAYGTSHLGDGICANDAGDLCITGEFFDSITWAPVTLESSTPEATIYVFKLNSDGDPVWVKEAGAGGYAIGESVDMDAAGNAYVTGFYRGTITMGSLTLPGPSDMSYDVFVAKCASADGHFMWATSGVGPASDRAVGIRVDASGNSYINGFYADTWTFGSTTLETNGGVDGYVAKLSPDGAPLWAKGYGGPASDYVGGLALHGTDVFVTGSFLVNMTLDQLPQLTGQDVLRDVFVAKLMDDVSGIAQREKPELVLYPDPAVERVQVRGTTGVFRFSVVDAAGCAVLAGGSTGERGVDVSALAPGRYVLCVDGPRGVPEQRLGFVKQ